MLRGQDCHVSRSAAGRGRTPRDEHDFRARLRYVESADLVGDEGQLHRFSGLEYLSRPDAQLGDLEFVGLTIAVEEYKGDVLPLLDRNIRRRKGIVPLAPNYNYRRGCVDSGRKRQEVRSSHDKDYGGCCCRKDDNASRCHCAPRCVGCF